MNYEKRDTVSLTMGSGEWQPAPTVRGETRHGEMEVFMVRCPRCGCVCDDMSLDCPDCGLEVF